MNNIVLFLLISGSAFAGEEAFDWTACDTELTENCAEKSNDKDKHDCIGKMDREKISEDCFIRFKSLCKQFGKRCSHYHVNKNSRNKIKARHKAKN